MHITAALVGLATAALIVYIVFGSASEQGATQDGAAPEALTATNGQLCGTIKPAASSSPAARKEASANLPAIYNEDGLVPAIRKDEPEQIAWFGRVHAASGMCIDQITVIADAGTSIELTTTDDVSEADAAAYVGGAVAQVFTPPLKPLKLTFTAGVGETKRTIVISQRAWNAFRVGRGGSGPMTAPELAAFAKASSFAATDLRVNGW